MADRWRSHEEPQTVLEFRKTLLEQSTVTQAGLKAAVEVSCAVISLVRYGSITMDLDGQLVFLGALAVPWWSGAKGAGQRSTMKTKQKRCLP